MTVKIIAKTLLAIMAIVAPSVSPARAQAIEVDGAIAPYAKTSGISGSLNSVGSDTLNNLMTLWNEGFRSKYPNVKVQVEGKGSSTAPPALIKGTAQLGPMSRSMKATELDEFEKSFGYKPTQIAVAIDALAVYVNKDNPLEELTFEQVDAIFSKTRRCGSGNDALTWGDLGLTGSWAGRPISTYGRNSASGTYGYFKKNALCGGDFRDTVKEQPGSSSVVNGVAEDRYGIGYSGIGYRTSDVKPLRLAKRKSEEFFSTDTIDVMSGRYPLSRFLYLYINKAPQETVDPLIREFVRFVLAQEGQVNVVKDGYLPLSAAMAEKQLAKLR